MNSKLEIRSPAPILNTPDFSFAFGGRDGNSIPTNEKGHPYCYEFIALKGAVFEVLEQKSEFIARVSHAAYPGDLFLDTRFAAAASSEKLPRMPLREQILKRMRKRLGKPYVWGGNWSQGIPELLSLYPPKGPIDERTRILWTLDGVDCSGLLYEAADGATPRNVSQLIHYGKGLKIKGLQLNEILSKLEPLDMILYWGHVLFIIGPEAIIESKSPFGVIQRNLRERMEEIYREKIGVDDWDPALDPESQFAIRRFL